jgi:hypothetical protein
VTAQQMHDRFIDAIGAIEVIPGLVMRVKVIDVRQAYGRTDVKVAPVSDDAGQGATWINVVKFRKDGSK